MIILPHLESETAARYVPNVYCYEQIPIPRQSENPMNINYFVDIDTTFDQKIVSELPTRVNLKNINKLDLMLVKI